MKQIIEAHWSINKNDNHQQDDADCTYTVVNDNSDLLGIVTKLSEAKMRVKDKNNDYILC